MTFPSTYYHQPYFCFQSLPSLFGVEESEDDDCSVAGEEHEHMPGGVEVGEPQAGPETTEDPVVDPADHSQQPEHNASSSCR